MPLQKLWTVEEELQNIFFYIMPFFIPLCINCEKKKWYCNW